jgi:recombination protein RecR
VGIASERRVPGTTGELGKRMQLLVEPVARLIDEFSRLPGIGPKTASRLAFYLLRAPEEQAQSLAGALRELRERITFCSICFNITETDPCTVCTDEGRDRSVICVVEEPLDVIAIERTRDYHGLYHVLHGTIAPVEGIGPDELRIAELSPRLDAMPPVREVIIATNPNMEGEATAMYVARQLEGRGIRVTRLARGLPVGGDLEYADEVTLSRALAGRQVIT